MDAKRGVLIFIAVALVTLFPGGFAHTSSNKTQDPILAEIFITNDEKNVLLFARLVNPFQKDMESAILAGVPVTFTLHLDIYRERSGVWDEHITEREIRRTIKYDNLKKTFLITTNGNPNPVILQDFESARKAMGDFSGIVVIGISSLIKNNTYYVRVKVKIDKVRLPLYMEYVFFFVSLWDTETPTYRQRFSY